MRILIVDDNETSRRLMRTMVADWATAVYEAADGVTGFQACAEHQPDWVLMDLCMRPVNGIAATIQIKARYPKMRVLLVSQCDEHDLEAMARLAGASGFLLKENLAQLKEHLLPAAQADVAVLQTA
jgi:CheY-like chemotaxis protein